MVLVAFFRAGQNGWLDWFGDITSPAAPSRSARCCSSASSPCSPWCSAGCGTAGPRPRTPSSHPTVPDEIDPYAGGYPVPPLPGQRLREPSLDAPALTSGSETKEAVRG